MRSLYDIAQGAMIPERKFTDAVMSICSFCVRRSGVPWDVPSHVLEWAAAKMVPFMKWGTILVAARSDQAAISV